MKNGSTDIDEQVAGQPEPGRSASVPKTGDSGRRWRLERRVVILALQLGLFAVFLLCWELLSGDPREGALLDDFFFSRPTDVLDGMQRWYRSGNLVTDVWITLQETLIGFAIGTLSGGIAGFVLGVSPKISAVFRPFVSIAYSVPRLAFAPLFILWFGLGMQSKIALVVVMTFFLTFFNSFAGAQDVDQSLLNTLRIMRASRLQVHMKVTVPSSAVWIITGLRISLPFAFAAAIVGEMIASNQGVGHRIIRSGNQFDAPMLFAAITGTVIMSMFLLGIINLIERRVRRWKVGNDHYG